MKPSDDLFQLIKKLSKSEKRYFILTAQLQKGKKNYLEIFRQIEKMTAYDEEDLKRKLLKKGIKIAQIHVTKNALYNNVLKSLRSYHEKNGVEQKIYSCITEAGLLEAKGLYRQSEKRLGMAHKLATKYEMLNLQLELTQREILLKVDKVRKGIQQFLDERHSQINLAAQIAAKERAMEQLFYNIYALYQTRGSYNNKEMAKFVGEFRSQELLKDLNKQDSFKTKLNYYYSHAILYQIEYDYTSAHPYFKKLLKIWEDYPHMKKENSRYYKSILTNYLNSCHTIGDYTTFQKLLRQFQEIPDTTEDEEVASFQNYYHLCLLYYMNTDQFEQGLAIVPEIESGFDRFMGKISASRVISISLNTFLLLYTLQKFDKAYDWLLRVPAGSAIETRNDLQIAVHILQLIVHFELGNIRMLDDLQNTVYRTLRRLNKLNQFEKLVLNHIRNLQKAHNKRSNLKQWKHFYHELLQIEKRVGIANTAGLMEALMWARSHAEKISFKEAAKRIEQEKMS